MSWKKVSKSATCLRQVEERPRYSKSWTGEWAHLQSRFAKTALQKDLARGTDALHVLRSSIQDRGNEDQCEDRTADIHHATTQAAYLRC